MKALFLVVLLAVPIQAGTWALLDENNVVINVIDGDWNEVSKLPKGPYVRAWGPVAKGFRYDGVRFYSEKCKGDCMTVVQSTCTVHGGSFGVVNSSGVCVSVSTGTVESSKVNP